MKKYSHKHQVLYFDFFSSTWGISYSLLLLLLVHTSMCKYESKEVMILYFILWFKVSGRTQSKKKLNLFKEVEVLIQHYQHYRDYWQSFPISFSSPLFFLYLNLSLFISLSFDYQLSIGMALLIVFHFVFLLNQANFKAHINL